MKGSNVRTDIHDYQADDGLWYPSNELESYFKPTIEEALVAAMEFMLADGYKNMIDALNKELYRCE